MAAAIADKAGLSAHRLTCYAAAHLDRTLNPTFVVAAKGWWHAIPRRKLPATLAGLLAFGRYTTNPDPDASPVEREARVRKQFRDFLRVAAPGIPDSVFDQAADEFVTKILASMNAPAEQASSSGVGPDI
jgi:hypothetical protein